MFLTGTFHRSIDDKLRVPIPKPLRAAFESPDGGGLYLAPGTDRSLALYPEGAFARLAEHLARTPPTRQDVRAFVRLFYARAQHAELDGQGRVRIPRELIELAGLEKEVVLLGVQDHLEIWSTPHWEEYLAERRTHYDEIAEAAFGGPDPTD